MTLLIWGWAAVWLAVRLWLEWRVDSEWLPGTADVREEWTTWSVPPPNALTPEGERLWRVLYQVTVGGFLGWLLLATLWVIG
jgi:hypothetical protein